MGGGLAFKFMTGECGRKRLSYSGASDNFSTICFVAKFSWAASHNVHVTWSIMAAALYVRAPLFNLLNEYLIITKFHLNFARLAFHSATALYINYFKIDAAVFYSPSPGSAPLLAGSSYTFSYCSRNRFVLRSFLPPWPPPSNALFPRPLQIICKALLNAPNKLTMTHFS